jgi:alpha-glucosidase
MISSVPTTATATEHNDDIAKMMAALYLTLRGSAIMYYGEEIGMENNNPKREEDVKDPEGRTGWPKEIGRDGERTPMQWDDTTNAGFSTHDPWLPVPPSYKTHNVATESKDPNSVLEFYRKVLAQRHTNPVLLEGNYTALNEDDANILSYLRTYKGKSVLVVLNMATSSQKPTFTLPGSTGKLKSLVATQGVASNGAEVSLPPLGILIAEVQ